jgi:hypothetical protein
MQLVLFGRVRLALLLAGLFVVSTGVLLIAVASQTIAIAANQDLTRFWRTTYDILVRPAGVRSPIEKRYGLVEANNLSGIWGGITFEQYEAIQSIPGVEVVAPIAMIGYISGGTASGDMMFPPEPGVYLFEENVIIDDGVSAYTSPDFPRRSYYYFDRNPQEPPSDGEPSFRQIGDLTVNDPSPTVHGGILFPFLIAGIDPSQEKALVGLDRALMAGKYLQTDESTTSLSITMESTKPLISLPILINATNYVNLTHEAELKRVILPDDATLEGFLARGGTSYLATLPTQTIAVVKTDGGAIYRRMIEQIAPQLVGVVAPLGPTALVGSGGIGSTPGPIAYTEAQAPLDYQGVVLEIVLPSDGATYAWPQYRASLALVEFDVVGMWDPKGIFDIELIPKPADVQRVPLETYFPPVAILQYDEQGHPVSPPRTLRPTLNPAGYIQSPPLLLTTLEAARALRGDNAISAIRVRVGGIDELSPAAQRKIETIAGEIARRTGLDVDIMVGSSPTRVLVHVPGIGYVEEQWIQKNVTASYQKRVQTGHLLLLGTLLGIGGLFTLDLTWAEVVAHRRTIALQKALGWRSSTVFVQALGQVLLVGVVTAALGALAAYLAAWLLGWELPTAPLLVSVPLIVVGFCSVGGIYPAWLASRVPPVVGLQHGGIRYRRGAVRLPTRRPLDYVWQGMSRRWDRTALGGLTATLSAVLLVLMLAVTVDRQGAMEGTLLGEFILVRIEGYHYAIVGIGFMLAALSLANSLLAGVLERRREIGVLKALGWRTGAVAQLFLAEGLLIGMLGGLIGAALGLAAFVGLYGTVSPSLGWIGLVGIGLPILVGLLAALYPARVAAGVLPAEAVRYE